MIQVYMITRHSCRCLDTHFCMIAIQLTQAVSWALRSVLKFWYQFGVSSTRCQPNIGRFKIINTYVYKILVDEKRLYDDEISRPSETVAEQPLGPLAEKLSSDDGLNFYSSSCLPRFQFNLPFVRKLISRIILEMSEKIFASRSIELR